MRITDLTPHKVFGFFNEISKIPRGSGNTKAFAEYLMEFAKSRFLGAHYDKGGNVIIFKQGTAGYENSKPVILQGHMDMVCDKLPECSIDMEREGLRLCTDGIYVWADGTTLGGDDGIAAAYILALLDSLDLEHPPIEALFTRDEENGMEGARQLDESKLLGKRMINLDSEEEGIFTAGCAGGVRVSCEIPVENYPANGICRKIRVNGLMGGHSGVDIGKNRANAIKLLSEILISLDFKVYVCSLHGGIKDNVIPNSAEADIIAETDADTFDSAVCGVRNKLLEEWGNEKNLKITAAECENHAYPCGTPNISPLIRAMPDGVIKRSGSGDVLTSLNLGSAEYENEVLSMKFFVRSNLNDGCSDVTKKLDGLVKKFGGTAVFSSSYPAWEYKENSPLRDTMAEVFKKQYGREPKIEIIHAGLECGILSDKLGGADIISIGPDLTDIHTPNEKMNIESVRRVWEFLLLTLKELK